MIMVLPIRLKCGLLLMKLAGILSAPVVVTGSRTCTLAEDSSPLASDV